MNKKKDILIFGSNGVIGKSLCEALNSDYNIYASDIHADSVIEVYRYYNINSTKLNEIYNRFTPYAVIHCQQFKGKKFLKTDLFNLNLEDFDAVMDTNVRFVLNSIINYAKNIKEENSIGRVINFTSTYGLISSNPSLYENTEMNNPIYYTISKFALTGLTKYLASYFKNYNILTNSISPHGIENNQSDKFVKNFSKRSPIGRLSLSEEVLPAVKFLLDEHNTYTNGANISVDGGWTAC